VATKEQIYTAKLEKLGVYDPAFDDAIHQLCILEREHSRVQKAWSASKKEDEKHPSFTHELYPVILQLRRDIRASRDELGLTPKALRKLKGNLDLGGEAPAEDKTVLGFILAKHEDG